MIVKKENKYAPIILWAVFLLSLLLYLMFNISITTNLSKFASTTSDTEPNSKQSALFYIINNVTESGNIFLVFTPSSVDEINNLSNTIRDDLASSKIFSHVWNGSEDNSSFVWNKVFSARYLLSPDVREDKFTTEGLRQALVNRLSDIYSGMGGIIKQTLAHDPHAFYLKYLSNINVGSGPRKENDVWVTQTGESGLMLLEIEAEGYELDVMENALTVIESVMKEYEKKYHIKYNITGPPVIAVKSKSEIEKTSRIISFVAGGLVLILFSLFYRKITVIFLVLLPIFTAILASMAATQWLFGEIHGITIVFGITLMSVCLDYPVHYISHLGRDEPANVLRGLWPTLKLGVITTGIAYLSLYGTQFVGLSQIAVFSIIGLVVSIMVTRFVLPVMVPEYVSIQNLKFIESMVHMKEKLDVVIRRYRYAVSVMLAAVLVVVLYTGDNVLESNVSVLSPIPYDVLKNDQSVRDEFNQPRYERNIVIKRREKEELLEVCESVNSDIQPLLKKKIVSEVVSPCTILPSKVVQDYRKKILPDKAILQQRLDVALSDLPFKKDFFQPFIEDVEKSRTRTFVDVDDFRGTPLLNILDSGLQHKKTFWVGVIRIGQIYDRVAFHSWWGNFQKDDVWLVDVRNDLSLLISKVNMQALLRLMFVLPIIIIFVLLYLREPKKTVWFALPVLLGLLMTISAVNILGYSLNIFHILSLILVVGVGMDYCVFQLRESKDKHEYLQTWHGVLLSAVTTSLTFGVMALSNLPVLKAMGMTVSIGIISMFIVSFLIIPVNKIEQDNGV